jgi:hypothetical protein
MEAWRDSVSIQVQNEFDYLAATAMPFAIEMIEQHGDFFPFGATLDIDDNGRVITAEDNTDRRQPASHVLVEALRRGMRADADVLKCVALVVDLRLEDTDVISIQLEHRGGQTLTLLVPYSKKRFGRGVTVADTVVLDGERHIW